MGVLVQQKELLRQHQAKLVAKWNMGENKGLQQCCILVWRDLAVREGKKRLVEHQAETIGSIIDRLTESEAQGILQMVFNLWSHTEARVNGQFKFQFETDELIKRQAAAE